MSQTKTTTAAHAATPHLNLDLDLAVADLKAASAQGGVDAIKAPLAKVGESCKTCHTAFKQD